MKILRKIEYPLRVIHLLQSFSWAQNTALLAKVAAAELVAGVDRECMEQVLRNVLSPSALEANLEVFNNAVSIRG